MLFHSDYSFLYFYFYYIILIVIYNTFNSVKFTNKSIQHIYLSFFFSTFTYVKVERTGHIPKPFFLYVNNHVPVQPIHKGWIKTLLRMNNRSETWCLPCRIYIRYVQRLGSVCQVVITSKMMDKSRQVISVIT